MQVKLYQSLVAVNVPPELAEATVKALEEHVDMVVGNQLQQVLSRLDSIDARFVAMDARFGSIDQSMQSLTKELKAEITAMGYKTIVGSVGFAGVVFTVFSLLSKSGMFK